MTSIGICKGIGVKPRLIVESSLCEFLKEELFPRGMSFDQLFVKSVEDLQALKGFEIPEGLEIVTDQDTYFDKMWGNFPE